MMDGGTVPMGKMSLVALVSVRDGALYLFIRI